MGRCRFQGIQSQIESQHIDARLAQQTQGAAFRVLGKKRLHLRQRQSTRLCDARGLLSGVVQRNMRVQTGGRRGHRIHGHWGVCSQPVDLAVRGSALRHGVDQGRIGRPLIAAGRGTRVAGGINAFAGVLRVRRDWIATSDFARISAYYRRIA